MHVSTILVTGGAGFIGSHTCLSLLHSGYRVVVIDNLCNSSIEAIKRVEELAGSRIRFIEGDVKDAALMDNLFSGNDIDAVIHFAGLKSVNESVEMPLAYYNNNIGATFTLLQAMQTHGVKKIVFSSSATVYGNPRFNPIPETASLHQSNPYGRCKRIIEQILEDIQIADNSWHIAILRYFNPVGAHPSGRIGEDPIGIPNNLFPYIARVVGGKLEKLQIYGNDYPTPDGTGIRDYIHITDLAWGHIKAIEQLQTKQGCGIYNLGTGKGYSVMDVLKTFETVVGKPIPFQIVDKRPGDVAACFANPAKAKQELNWEATHGLEEMVRDTVNWQKANPDGYKAIKPDHG